jgi:hypothetical protein
MGNIAAIDQGCVILRCAIFDRHNILFPRKIQEEERLNNPQNYSFYLLPELSFYSSFHGGTFHFFQLNVLRAEEFIKSAEFHHLIGFLKNVYSDADKGTLTEAKM